MATMPPLGMYGYNYTLPYDPDEAKAWLESLMQYKSTNILNTVATVPISPCPVTHPGCASELVGSTLVFGTIQNDIDYLFYCPAGRYTAFHQQLDEDGWLLDGVSYQGSNFESWRKDKFNLIVTTNFVWYKKFVAAAQLCKKLSLYSKDMRIAVHEAMLKDYEA